MTVAETLRAEIERLHRTEHEMDARRDALLLELENVRLEAGAAVLDAHLSGAGSPDTSRLATAQAELTALEAAIAAARERRATVIPRYQQALAAEKQAEAAAIRERVADIAKQRRAILAQVKELEETAMTPLIRWEWSADALAEHHHHLLQHERRPLTQRLIDEAEILERQSLQVTGKQKSPYWHRAAGSEDVEELVTKACGNPLNIGPLPSVVRVWAAEAEAELRRYPTSDRDRRFVRWQLEWMNGEIDRKMSHAGWR